MTDTSLEQLSKFGITELWQVGLVMPLQYKDLRLVQYDLNPYQGFSGMTLFGGHIHSVSDIKLGRTKKRSPFIIVELTDQQGFRLKTFVYDTAENLKSLSNGLAMANQHHPIYVYGLPEYQNQQLILKNQEFIAPDDLGRLHVCYELAKGRSKAEPKVIDFLSSLLSERDVIKECADKIRELLSATAVSNKRLKQFLGAAPSDNIEQMLQEIHFPDCVQRGYARIRQVSKLAAVLIGAEAKELASQWGVKRVPLQFKSEAIENRIKSLPFQMTEEQKSAALSMVVQMTTAVSQHMMLIGDVGTGKSCVIGTCAASVVDAGGRVAIMLPTSNLARQLHREFSEYYPDISPTLVIEGEIIEEISQCRMLIGTTAIIHKQWPFTFDLAVVDEQHKFSVEQRELFCADGAHLLESTATPVPRTAALLKHGVLKVYELKHCFVDKRIESRLLEHYAGRDLAIRALKTLQSGQKLLIVCALKDESKCEAFADIQNATETYEKWCRFIHSNRHVLPDGSGVVLAHGGLTNEENAAAIDALNTGDANVLVATTLVETGLTIKGLTHCIVMNPDRLGLVQLHQLRGRLARHGGVGYFDLLLPLEISPKSKDRLELISQISHGVTLAIEDMKLRGFGDLTKSGRSQTGVNQRYLFGYKINLDDLNDAIELIDTSS